MTPEREVTGASTPGQSASFSHLNRHIPPLAHTAMYVWHKYWGRKTWNVVGEFIKTYCPPGGVVLDPFSGSGVVAMEALKQGRRVIVCDLSPVATEITRLTIKPVDIQELRRAFERVEKKVKDKILSLYETKCRKCGKIIPMDCAVWKDGRYTEIRYENCSKCGDRQENKCFLNAFDKKKLKEIEELKIRSWYPKNRLEYSDGTPFKERQQYKSIDELFTKRNLTALAWLMEKINDEKDKDLRDFLKIAFTSMVHLCSRMRPEDQPGRRPFSGAGWTQHSYWFAKWFLEVNVWNTFERAVIGRQSLLGAKQESNEFFSRIRIASKVDDVLEEKAHVYIHNGDSIDFMKTLAERRGECVDYIFTDPPYDASVQYGELTYLWASWLGKDEAYTEELRSHEVVRNERQGKPYETYHSLLKNAFLRMYEAIKSNRFMTITFHNPTFRVRNDTIHAGVVAGFELQKIHHQPLGQKSPKALLQPFGSAQGDFYLRFYKHTTSQAAQQPGVMEDQRFERIVVETAKRIIAERGEPTPYTILINAIDPELAKNGHFRETTGGLDVRKVLEKHLDQEFVLVSVLLGDKKGEAWWFKNPSTISHLESVPLDERVEQTVLRKLQAQGKVTFTDMWKAISEEFPNSLTTDVTSIRDALETYARKSGREEWLIKENFKQAPVKRTHTRMIAILADIGKAKSYGIWIGRREQRDSISEGFPNRQGELRQYLTRDSLDGIENARNFNDVEFVDILWLKGKKIVAAFEIETTTAMTEALKRGSNIDPKVLKYMIIPQDREEQLQRKLKSPLFADRFVQDSWKVIYAEKLDSVYAKEKEDVDVEAIQGVKMPRALAKVVKENRNQLGLFGGAEEPNEESEEEESE